MSSQQTCFSPYMHNKTQILGISKRAACVGKLCLECYLLNPLYEPFVSCFPLYNLSKLCHLKKKLYFSFLIGGFLAIG